MFWEFDSLFPDCVRITHVICLHAHSATICELTSISSVMCEWVELVLQKVCHEDLAVSLIYVTRVQQMP